MPRKSLVMIWHDHYETPPILPSHVLNYSNRVLKSIDYSLRKHLQCADKLISMRFNLTPIRLWQLMSTDELGFNKADGSQGDTEHITGHSSQTMTSCVINYREELMRLLISSEKSTHQQKHLALTVTLKLQPCHVFSYISSVGFDSTNLAIRCNCINYLT